MVSLAEDGAVLGGPGSSKDEVVKEGNLLASRPTVALDAGPAKPSCMGNELYQAETS